MAARMDGVIRAEKLKITLGALKLIAEISEFKRAWMALGRISPERSARVRIVRDILNTGIDLQRYQIASTRWIRHPYPGPLIVVSGHNAAIVTGRDRLPGENLSIRESFHTTYRARRPGIVGTSHC